MNSSSVTVNEKEIATFLCIVDSNPNSTVAIAFEDRIIYEQNNTKSIGYIHKATSCLEAGIYTCSARNQYSIGNDASAQLELLVKCK